MNNTPNILQKFILVTATAFALATISNVAVAASAEDLNKDAAQALQILYKSSPVAESLSKKAKAILIFPKIIKAGPVSYTHLTLPTKRIV